MGKKGRSILKKPSRPKPAKGVQKTFDCPVCEEINSVSVDLRKVNEHPRIVCSNPSCSLFSNPVVMKFPPSKLAMLDPIDIFTEFKDEPEKYLNDVMEPQSIRKVEAPVAKSTPAKKSTKAVSKSQSTTKRSYEPEELSDSVLEFD